MKKFIQKLKNALRRFSGRGLLTTAGACAALALLAVSPASAQVTPTTIYNLTNLTGTGVLTQGLLTIAGQGTTNLFLTNSAGLPTNNVLSVRQGVGFGFQGHFRGTNAAAIGCEIIFVPSFDGTNYCTNSANWIAATNAANGTMDFLIGSNFVHTLTDNALFITPYIITNCSALVGGGIAISNMCVTMGNVPAGGYP